LSPLLPFVPRAGERLNIRVELMPEPRPEKPRGVAVAAAIGRAPLLSDLDDMHPPYSTMLFYPPADATHEALSRATAHETLIRGGTAVVFTDAGSAAAAEAWLCGLKIEAAR
jgi:hypothetical protein